MLALANLCFLSLAVMQLGTVTLNVQSFRNPQKQQAILCFTYAVQCDLRLLQERNFRSRHDVATLETQHHVKGFFSFGTRCSEGVAIVVLRQSLRNDCAYLFNSDGRVVCFDFYAFRQKFRIVNVYGPAQQSSTNLFFRSINPFLLDPARFFSDHEFELSA